MAGGSGRGLDKEMREIGAVGGGKLNQFYFQFFGGRSHLIYFYPKNSVSASGEKVERAGMMPTVFTGLN